MRIKKYILIFLVCVAPISAYAQRCAQTTTTAPTSIYEGIIISGKINKDIQPNSEPIPLLLQFINTEIEYEVVIIETLKGEEKERLKVTPSRCHTDTSALAVGSTVIISLNYQGWKIEPKVRNDEAN